MHKQLWMFLIVVVVGCTSSKTNVDGVILPKKGSKTLNENMNHASNAARVPLPNPTYLPTLSTSKPSAPGEGCQAFSNNEVNIPFFIPLENSGIVVTRVLNPCFTREGRRGYEKNSPWMAMGFPCTGSPGKMHVLKPFQAPKMVSFTASTDCAMTPTDTETVKLKVKNAIGLGDDSKLLAFNPFAVQFWELEGYEDSDVGETVTLRETRTLNEGWNKFLKNEPFRVRLYGRENAWVPGNNLYQVDAAIKMVNNYSFKLEVTSAKALTPSEIEQLKKKCRSLQPRRNCSVILE